jgi:hypothetical protein
MCIHVGAMTHPSLHQDGETINSDRPRCRGVSAILRRATGLQPFGFAQGRKRGWKGGQQEPVTPLRRDIARQSMLEIGEPAQTVPCAKLHISAPGEYWPGARSTDLALGQWRIPSSLPLHP